MILLSPVYVEPFVYPSSVLHLYINFQPYDHSADMGVVCANYVITVASDKWLILIGGRWGWKGIKEYVQNWKP
jgi:hypothetical protein